MFTPLFATSIALNSQLKQSQILILAFSCAVQADSVHPDPQRHSDQDQDWFIESVAGV